MGKKHHTAVRGNQKSDRAPGLCETNSEGLREEQAEAVDRRPAENQRNTWISHKSEQVVSRILSSEIKNSKIQKRQILLIEELSKLVQVGIGDV